MYSNFTDKGVIERGKKKVYCAVEGLELSLPNGSGDGILEEGDLVYVVQKYKVGDKRALRFRVMKFAESAKESKVYCADKAHFRPYYDNRKLSEDGAEVSSGANSDIADESDSNKKTISKPKSINGKESPNYIVPTITALSGGIFGYLLAQKYNKSLMMYGTGGLVIGLALGIFILKQKQKSK